MTRLLVIGYGNELRGDDGVGPCVGRMVAAWNREDVRALAVHQLTPELTTELAIAERVVFVDATADAIGTVCWRPVFAGAEPTAAVHVISPGWLLGLTQQVFGHAPEAWIVTIPARELGHGAPLSPPVERNMQTVVRQIAAFARRQHRLSEVVDYA